MGNPSQRRNLVAVPDANPKLRRRTLADLRAIAREREGECLSAARIKTHQRARWRCAKGHVWDATPGSVINQGTWCPECAGLRITIDDIRKAAWKRGGRCLSTRYVNAHAKLEFECASGHRWAANANSLRSGHWCRLCGYVTAPRRYRLLTIGDMRRIAEKRGGRCVSRLYRPGPAKLEWECAEGHRWKAIGYTVKAGSWCGRCAGNAAIGLDESRRIARERGGTCLSKKYVNSPGKLLWRCEKGHVWHATASTVKGGQWCLRCANLRMRLTLDQMRKIAKANGGRCLSKTYVPHPGKMRFVCVRGHEFAMPAAKVRYGFWCRVCGLHYRGPRPIEDRTEWMHELAHKRGGVCLAKRYPGSRPKVPWRCAQGHIWDATPKDVRQGHWCPFCAGNARRTIEEMRELARSRGGACVSAEIHGVNENLRWRCALNHEWDATPKNVERGKSWCPRCALASRPRGRPGHPRPGLGISRMRQLANQRGGVCLSTEYQGVRAKLRWRCEKGHVWIAAPFGLVYANSWCPRCAGKRPTLGDFQAIARRHGGRCLSTRYLPNPHKLDWECKHGHRWSAPPMAAKEGRWCPRCAGRLVTIEDVRAKALENDGECLSDAYRDSVTRLMWRCAAGHRWSANWKSVQRGAWCPVCAGRARR